MPRFPLPATLRTGLRAGDLDGTRDWLRERAAETLVDGPGALVVSGLGTDAEELRRLCPVLSGLVGTLLPQDRAGTTVREVADRGTKIGEGVSARYADSRHGGSLHTDGAESPLPVPDYFALLCVRQAPDGGALRLVHVGEVVRALEPDVVAQLRRPFHFDRRGDQADGEPPTTEKPVLFDDGAETGVTYLREYIEVGHRHPGVPALTEAQRSALDRLDAVLEDPAVGSEDKMAAGEFALFANTRLLHGRTTFTDDSDPSQHRLLFRTWIQR
jgi:alpha-ketoglutarate-dependent taurine dioxygenase